MLPDLLDQIPTDEQIGSVTADGAYGTRKCHGAIAARDAAAVRQGNGPPDLFRTFLSPAAQERQALEADELCPPSRQISFRNRLPGNERA